MGSPIEYSEVSCPYCGEILEVEIDCTAGDQAYVEDCQVCCAPIEFSVQIDHHGVLRSLSVRRDDE